MTPGTNIAMRQPHQALAPRATKAGEQQRHHHLRDAAAQVAPTGGRGIRGSDNVRREHHRGVVLRDDEGRSDGADRQPEKQEMWCSRAPGRLPITGSEPRISSQV